MADDLGGNSAGGIDVYIQAHDNAYHQSMREAARAARDTGRQIAQAFNSNSFAQFGAGADRMFTGLGNRMRLLGRDLRNLSASMAAVSGFGAYLSGRAFINTAGEFEQKMEIIKALSGATEEQMRSLESQTISLGSSTARTAGEIAQGALELQKMGRSLSEIQLILPAITDFAIAADQPVERAANTAGSVLMQFRMQATETSRVMDTLTRGANQSAADVGDFSIALSYAGQQAFNANVSLERTVALMEAASNAGIPGSRLGTGLQSLLNDIYMPNMRQLALFRQFKIETREANGEMRDLYEVMQDIFTKLPQNQWGRFEVDTQNYLMALRGQGIGSIQARENDLVNNAGGEAARTAEARMRGLKGALDALGGAFDALMIKAGESGLTEVLTQLFRNIGGWVSSLSNASRETLFLAGALGGLLLMLNPLMFALGSMLAILTSPEGLIFAFVAVAGAAMVWSNVSAQIEGVQNALEKTREPMQQILSLNQQLATAAGDAADELRRQRDELTRTIIAQANAADARADAAEAAASRPAGMGDDAPEWLQKVTRFENQVMGIFGDSRTDQAARLRAEADALRRTAFDATGANMQRDTAEPNAVLPTTPPMLNGDMAAMMGQTAAAQLERQTRLLEAQAAAAGESVAAMQRLAAIQAIQQQGADSMGNPMGEAAATAIYERQRAAQGTIEHAMAQEQAAQAAGMNEKALAGTRVEINRNAAEQRVLMQAMEEGTRAYERQRLVLALLAENYGMTREEAVLLATQQEANANQMEEAHERMQRFAQAFQDIGNAMAGAFEQALLEGGSLGNMLKSLARDIAAIAIRASVTTPLGNWLGKGIAAAFSGGLPFGGGKAVGGTAWPGAAIEVGEQGREIFVPKVGGTILSAAQLANAGAGGGGGGGYVDQRAYNFHGSMQEMQEFEAAIRRLDSSIEGRSLAAFGNARRRGRV